MLFVSSNFVYFVLKFFSSLKHFWMLGEPPNLPKIKKTGKNREISWSFWWKTYKRVQLVQNLNILRWRRCRLADIGGFFCCEIEIILRLKSPMTPPPTPPVGQGERKKTGKNREISWSFCEKMLKKVQKVQKRGQERRST